MSITKDSKIETKNENVLSLVPKSKIIGSKLGTSIKTVDPSAKLDIADIAKSKNTNEFSNIMGTNFFKSFLPGKMKIPPKVNASGFKSAKNETKFGLSLNKLKSNKSKSKHGSSLLKSFFNVTKSSAASDVSKSTSPSRSTKSLPVSDVSKSTSQSSDIKSLAMFNASKSTSQSSDIKSLALSDDSKSKSPFSVTKSKTIKGKGLKSISKRGKTTFGAFKSKKGKVTKETGSKIMKLKKNIKSKIEKSITVKEDSGTSLAALGIDLPNESNVSKSETTTSQKAQSLKKSANFKKSNKSRRKSKSVNSSTS